MDDSNEKIAWFVAGAALGAAVAVLFAPASGEEMRQRLTASAGEGQRSLSDTGRDLLEQGRDLYDRGRQMADDAASMFEQGRKLAQSGPTETPAPSNS